MKEIEFIVNPDCQRFNRHIVRLLTENGEQKKH